MNKQDYNSSETPEQVEYNLSSFKIGWIAQLIQQADIHYLRGRTDKAFERWKCVYGQISNRIDEDENKKCKNVEGKFRKSLRNQNKVMCDYYYEKYQRFLQTLLKKYGFDMKMQEGKDHLV